MFFTDKSPNCCKILMDQCSAMGKRILRGWVSEKTGCTSSKIEDKQW